MLSVKGSFGTQGADRGMLFAPNFVLALQQGILVQGEAHPSLLLAGPPPPAATAQPQSA